MKYVAALHGSSYQRQGWLRPALAAAAAIVAFLLFGGLLIAAVAPAA